MRCTGQREADLLHAFGHRDIAACGEFERVDESRLEQLLAGKQVGVGDQPR